MKQSISAAAVTIAAISLTGCGGSTRHTGQTAKNGAVSASRGLAVSLGDYLVRPARITLAAGKTDLLVTNRGQHRHELVILKSNTSADRLPLRGNRVDEHAAGTNSGEADDLAPGQQRSVAVTLTPGRYVLICNLPGHYRKGMHAILTVL